MIFYCNETFCLLLLPEIDCSRFVKYLFIVNIYEITSRHLTIKDLLSKWNYLLDKYLLSPSSLLFSVSKFVADIDLIKYTYPVFIYVFIQLTHNSKKAIGISACMWTLVRKRKHYIRGGKKVTTNNRKTYK